MGLEAYISKSRRHLASAEAACRLPLDPLRRDVFGMSPLLLAVALGNATLVDVMLQECVRSLSKSSWGATSLSDFETQAHMAIAVQWALKGHWAAMQVTLAEVFDVLCPRAVGGSYYQDLLKAPKTDSGSGFKVLPSHAPGLRDYTELLGQPRDIKVPMPVTVRVHYGVLLLQNTDQLLEGLLHSAPVDLLQHPAIIALVQFKWEQHVFNAFLAQFLVYSLSLACWIMLSIGLGVWQQYVTIFAMCTPCLLLLLEIRVFWFRGRYYGRDVWSLMQVVALLGMTTSVILQDGPCRSDGSCIPEGSRALVAFLGFTTLLSYLRGFAATGAFINMLLATVVDISGFVLIIMVLIAAFAELFFELDVNRTHGLLQWVQISYSTFLLGSFNVDEDFGGASNMRVGFIAVTITGTLVFSNILIAIIGDTYDRIIDSKEIEGMRARIALVLKFDPRCLGLPNFLVIASQDSTAEEEWNGRLKEIKKHHLKTINELKEELVTSEQNLGKKIKELQNNLSERKLDDTIGKFEKSTARALKEINDNIALIAHQSISTQSMPEA